MSGAYTGTHPSSHPSSPSGQVARRLTARRSLVFRKGRAWKEVQRAGGRDLGGSSRSSGGTRLARSMPSSSREWRFESARGECSALLPNKFSEFMQEVGLAASKQGPHTRQEDQGVWPQSINQQVRGLRQPPHTAGRAPEPALMWRLCYTCICWHASETEQTVAGGGCLREYMPRVAVTAARGRRLARW